MRNRLLIIGAGGHGQVVRETAEAMKVFERIDFLDDRSLEAIGRLDELADFNERYDHAFVALGDVAMRREWLGKAIEAGYRIPSLVHPKAYVSPSASIESGAVILPMSVIQTNAVIGKGSIIGVGALIDHDAEIGEYSYIQAGTIIPSYSRIPCLTSLNQMQAAQMLLKIKSIK